MVQYAKTGGAPQVVLGATGGVTTFIPNHGVSLISATSSEIYALAPPEVGVRKTVVFLASSSTALTPTVRGSTAQTVTFTGSMGGNTALPTMFKLAATRSTNMSASVELLGLSSVAWQVTSVHPVMSSGLGAGSVTFSTT